MAWDDSGNYSNIDSRIADLEGQLTAANERAERYKAALEQISAGVEGWLSRAIADEALNPIPTSDTGENDG